MIYTNDYEVKVTGKYREIIEDLGMVLYGLTTAVAKADNVSPKEARKMILRDIKQAAKEFYEKKEGDDDATGKTE